MFDDDHAVAEVRLALGERCRDMFARVAGVHAAEAAARDVATGGQLRPLAGFSFGGTGLPLSRKRRSTSASQRVQR